MTDRRRRSLASYADIIPILDAALAAGGARFDLESRGAAVRWVQRANQARRTKQELEIERVRGIPGLDAGSPWDSLIICRNENQVEIRVRKPMPTIFDLEGNPISVAKTEAKIAEEEILDQAALLLKGLTS